MTEYISNSHLPGIDGVLTGLPGQQGTLYSWMRILAGGGTSEFSAIRMRGPIYDKNGAEILAGGGGGSLATLSDVNLGAFFPIQVSNVLAYSPAGTWTNVPTNIVMAPIGLMNGTVTLTDVSQLGVLVNGQRLIYNGQSTVWNNRHSYRLFAAIDGRNEVNTPGSLITFGTPLITYDSDGFFGIGPNVITTENAVLKFQYDIILELDATANDNASVQVYKDSVPYGPVFTQSVKTGDSLQFMLSGTFFQTGTASIGVFYTSSGGHNINAMAGSFTLVEI